jgi:hypothetical protein
MNCSTDFLHLNSNAVIAFRMRIFNNMAIPLTTCWFELSADKHSADNLAGYGPRLMRRGRRVDYSNVVFFTFEFSLSGIL